MSGALVRKIGIFVGPVYVTGTPGGSVEDRIMTSPINQWIIAEANATKTAMTLEVNPPLANTIKDQYGNVVGGGEPVVGAMLAIIHAQAPTGLEADAILAEIENLSDVRRYKPVHGVNAWQTIQTWLRGKGLDTIHLLDGGANAPNGTIITDGDKRVEELARRTACLIDPTFGSFPNGAFPVAPPA